MLTFSFSFISVAQVVLIKKVFVQLCALFVSLGSKTLPLLFIPILTYAQDSQTSNLHFLEIPNSPHKQRTTTFTIGASTIYAGTFFALSQAWYKNEDQTSFHFFNDNKEWLQVDKAGHLHTAYFYADWFYHGLLWTGMDNRKAVWYAAGASVLAQTTIEVFDGFAASYGASYGDIMANVVGTGTFTYQQLHWNEQRILVKYSVHPVDYKESLLIENRTDDLFGTNFFERALKDYNGQTYWLSVNPSSFMNKETAIPNWLNIAVGYGADDLYGGFSNTFESDDGIPITINRTRKRQFYLSPDIDLTKVKTNKRGIRLLLGMINVLKVPAPTFEINSEGHSKLHWLYF